MFVVGQTCMFDVDTMPHQKGTLTRAVVCLSQLDVLGIGVRQQIPPGVIEANALLRLQPFLTLRCTLKTVPSPTTKTCALK
jgi:hypothetical protein